MASEQDRHRCEVRMCLAKGFTWFETFIKDVKRVRGESAARLLWDDVKAQARLGNVGKPGDWREHQGKT